jgi:DNA-binding CsgD family transcriptional regulator
MSAADGPAGRGAELAALDAALARVAAGETTAVAVAGPAGSGKSALLDVLCERAGACGDRVLRTLGDPRDRFAVRRRLEALAEHGALVVAVDDVDRASAVTREAVGHLLRRPPAGWVLLAFAYRPAAADVRLREAVASAVQERALTLLEPGPPAEVQPAHLSPQALGLLRAAAVLGDPFELELALEVAGVPAAPAVDGLLAQGLVARDERPRHYRCRAPLAGEHALAPLHARAAAALRRREAPPTVLARHLEQAPIREDPGAVALLTEAGRASRALTPAAAAEAFAGALRALPGAASPEQRLALVNARAKALVATGDERAARDTLRAAPQTASAVAGLDHLGGGHRATAALLPALAGLAGHPTRARTTLRLELAFNALFASDWARMADAARDARDDALALDEPLLVAAATSVLAVAEHARGADGPARRCADAAADLAARLTDAEHAAHLEALGFAGLAETGLERFGAAREHLERAARIARTTGRTPWSAFLLAVLALRHVLVGRVGAAAGAAQAARAAAPELGRLRVWAEAMCCWTAALAGDVAGALAAGEQAARLAERTPVAFGWLAGSCRGEALLAAGRPELAYAPLTLPAQEIPRCWRPCHYERLVRADLATGALAAAERRVVAAEAAAAGVAQTGPRAEALRARARLALARGDAPAADAAAGEAARCFQAIGRRVDAARARVLAGRALIALGERERAAAELDHAHRLFAAAGAVPFRDTAAAELRRLGRRPTPAGGTARLARLSAREREVAGLVARGLSNRAIAHELVLSAKTVERHLSRIFDKASVSSRAELAGLVRGEREPAA